MKTRLTKKQKVTALYFNAKDTTAEIYTYDMKLKRQLREYAAKYPQLCQPTEDDEQGSLCSCPRQFRWTPGAGCENQLQLHRYSSCHITL